MSWDKLFSASAKSQELKGQYAAFFSTLCNVQKSSELQSSIKQLVKSLETDYENQLMANEQLIIELRYQLLARIYSEIAEGRSFFIESIRESIQDFYLDKLQKCLCLTSSEEKFDTTYELVTADDSITLYSTGCQGDGTEGQRKVARALGETIKSSSESSTSLLILTGDNVYPTVSLETTAAEIKPYFAPYQKIGVNYVFAALGNHESGAIKDLPHQDAAKGNQVLLLRRREHAAAIIHDPDKGIYCHPYYTVLCRKYGEALPYLRLIIIDSTNLAFDPHQQAWLKSIVNESKKVKNTVLVSHHAIGKTLGKRNLKKNEQDLYGKYQPRGKPVFVGNQHQVLEEVFHQRELFKYLKRWFSLVAHDHFLAYDEHPDYGKVIYTGGGSTHERTSPKYTLPGQKFPPIVPAEQQLSNKKAQTGGFIKLQYQNAKPLTLEIINANSECLYQQQFQNLKLELTDNEVNIADIKKNLCLIMGAYMQTGVIRYVFNPLLRAGSFFCQGHQHNDRAESLIHAINNGDFPDLASLNNLIEDQISLINKKQQDLPEQRDLLAKHKQIPLSKKLGGFYKQLLEARSYLSQYPQSSPSNESSNHFSLN